MESNTGFWRCYLSFGPREIRLPKRRVGCSTVSCWGGKFHLAWPIHNGDYIWDIFFLLQFHEIYESSAKMLYAKSEMEEIAESSPGKPCRAWIDVLRHLSLLQQWQIVRYSNKIIPYLKRSINIRLSWSMYLAEGLAMNGVYFPSVTCTMSSFIHRCLVK